MFGADQRERLDEWGKMRERMRQRADVDTRSDGEGVKQTEKETKSNASIIAKSRSDCASISQQRQQREGHAGISYCTSVLYVHPVRTYDTEVHTD